MTTPSQLVLGSPLWALDPGRALHILGLGGAYLLAVVLTASGGGPSRPRPRRALLAGVVSLAFLYLGLLVGRAYYARSVLLGGSAAVIVFVVVPTLRTSHRRTMLLCLVGTLAVSSTTGLLADDADTGGAPTVSRETINTAHHSLRAVSYEGLVGSPRARGGGVEVLGDGFLLTTGDGELYRLHWVEGTDFLTVEELGTRVPLNVDEFAADVGPRVHIPWFRVADLLVRETGDGLRLLASHHRWKDETGCFVLRVSALTTSRDALAGGELGSDWETLFETEPCLPIEDHPRGHVFAGLRAGGRMATLDSARVLLTVGDHGFDGWKSDRALPRDPDADYGKILVLRGDGSAETFSVGHRNPQGLHVDRSGTVWSTEHGPEGGDELNRIVRGGDYGWPVETYGTAYGDVAWPRSREAEGAPETRSPFYAWVPSVGVSNLLSVGPSSFSRWEGDLLVASLKGRSLFRVETDDRDVAYVERVGIGERIRDLVQGPGGRIVLWTDGGGFVSLRPAVSTDRGAVLFRRCVGCHAADEGHAPGRAPDLGGIVGREVASLEGYEYSAALRSVDGRWTRARLDSFLTDPRTYAPGTKMGAPGVVDEADRDALIDYLARQD